jgi:hypothetical protein
MNGAEIGESLKEINREVQVGDYCEVTVDFVAPKRIGSYTAFYKLVHGPNKKQFGQKVWCEILVSEPEDEIARLQKEMNSFF